MFCSLGKDCQVQRPNKFDNAEISTLAAVRAILASAAFCGLCCAYAQPPNTPAFESASIELAPQSAVGRLDGGPGTNSPTQLTGSSIPLRPLLLIAYGLKDNQLVGPRSIDRDRYNIVAIIPPNSTKEQVSRMLQGLLAKRLRLAVHWKKTRLRIYELRVSDGGPKFDQSDKPSDGALAIRPNQPELPPGARWGVTLQPTNQEGGFLFSARLAPIRALLGLLENETGRAVVDKTGLNGRYNFSLFYERTQNSSGPQSPHNNRSAPTGDGLPALTAALEQQLGLELESKEDLVKVLVVDHVDRKPTGK